MSGYEAYLSFANFVKAQLAGSGIDVVIEKQESYTPPYLYIQDGPDRVKRDWISARMCQGSLVVAKLSTEPLVVTMGKALDKVIRATTDPGQIEKYNYATSPKTLVGNVIPKIFEITGDLSSDPLRSKKVITWQLFSNNV